MAMLVFDLNSLHMLHWLFSLAVPAVIILLAFISWLLILRIERTTTRPLARLSNDVDNMSGRSMANWPTVQELMRRHFADRLDQTIIQIKEDSKNLYQGRWLPEPATALPLAAWLSLAKRSAISLRPAVRLLASGFLATLVALLIQIALPLKEPALGLIFVLLPLFSALLVALPLAVAARQQTVKLEEQLALLHHGLARHLPVFGEHTGVAALVDTFLEYDNQMQNRLADFTAVAERLAESEMADGIRRSVEQVLTESVAPSLQQSTGALADLAQELTRRQEEGMADLAGQFAKALSSQLAAHMQPVNKEISQMASLMADVKNYVDVALRSLDTVNQQSVELQQDVAQTLDQLGQIQVDLARDNATTSQQMERLAGLSERMTGLFAGSEDSLALSLEQFSQKLDESTRQLSDTTQQAIRLTQEVRVTATEQGFAVEKQQESMQQHSRDFADHLASSVDDMLGQVRAETDAVAANTAEIGKQMQVLNSTLNRSLDLFSQESAAYVHKTLLSFDQSLADIVSRLAQTTSEIQDAVDALPGAISRSIDYGHG